MVLPTGAFKGRTGIKGAQLGRESGSYELYLGLNHSPLLPLLSLISIRHVFKTIEPEAFAPGSEGAPAERSRDTIDHA